MSRAAHPIGIFVHHQGRGHAERAASLANALNARRDIVLFCARDDIFPPLRGGVQVMPIPSLFEPSGDEPPGLANIATPDTLHCAPLGWSPITQAIGTIAQWFAAAQPSLFITDVSAELGQLARIASVPHLAVLQHGKRSDPAHEASYRAAVGLLAPYAETLEQRERPEWLREKTIHAPGIGIDCSGLTNKASARRKLGLPQDLDLVVALGGGGGTGLPSAPLTLGARDEPASQWVTLGHVHSEWHETPPANLRHMGWVENAAEWISAADRLVSSAGNTTVHLLARAGKPWIVVPEWRYFAEQVCKAQSLQRIGAAAVAMHWPASSGDWRVLWESARRLDPAVQQELVDPKAAARAATAIEALIARIWSISMHEPEPVWPRLQDAAE